jgi:hypothetical protein
MTWVSSKKSFVSYDDDDDDDGGGAWPSFLSCQKNIFLGCLSVDNLFGGFGVCWV